MNHERYSSQLSVISPRDEGIELISVHPTIIPLELCVCYGYKGNDGTSSWYEPQRTVSENKSREKRERNESIGITAAFAVREEYLMPHDC
jgi:hypothetical protein